jgi:hypothetical protein
MAVARKVYDTLTVDLGGDNRTEITQAANVLDLDGLLHVNDVERFVDAVREWRNDVLRAGGEAVGRSFMRHGVLQLLENRAGGQP